MLYSTIGILQTYCEAIQILPVQTVEAVILNSDCFHMVQL